MTAEIASSDSKRATRTRHLIFWLLQHLVSSERKTVVIKHQPPLVKVHEVKGKFLVMQELGSKTLYWGGGTVLPKMSVSRGLECVMTV